MRQWARMAAIFFFCGSLLGSQNPPFYPDAHYDTSVPTLKGVVGHDWGERVTTPAEVEVYLRRLSDASDEVRLVRYGETWEGRSLYYLVLASREHLERLSAIQSSLRRLADPRTLAQGEAESLIQSLPAVVWLAYGVHGNEVSSTDAALLMAYHLAASQQDPVAQQILEQAIVLVDPMQNPDGRARFVAHFRQTRGRWSDPDPNAAEHREPWPSGRVNHYLFDMNRDWFALTQPETRARVAAFLQWFPQVFADLHEMGANSSYYFPPPAKPWNPHLTPEQLQWLRRLGHDHARWFDRMGFDYFTGEVFDSFYPGYGEEWPMFQGAVGMTFEQASSNGLVIRRRDHTLLRYRDAVQHHFISSLATAQTVAQNRKEFLRYFYNYRRSAIEEGTRGQVGSYIFPPTPDSDRTRHLVEVLMAQGIEVERAEAPFRLSRARSLYDGKEGPREFPAGSYLVSLEQPAGRLVRTLLARQTPMDEEFIREQQRRHRKRLADEIYDVTAWSLPFLYDVDCFTSGREGEIPRSKLARPPLPQGSVEGSPAKLAYLAAWGSNATGRALAALLGAKVRVEMSDRSFRIEGRTFPAGSLIIKVRGNGADLASTMARVARETGAHFVSTGTSWVEAGVNFGSEHVHLVPPPHIALAWDRPTRPGSAGAVRYLLEQAYGYRVTLLPTARLGRVDLADYDVLILPDSYGGYARVLGEGAARRIRSWIRGGGTLVALGEAVRWLTAKKIHLLNTTAEYKGGLPVEEGEEKRSAKPPSGEYDYQKAIQPEKELPSFVPGAILRVHLDGEHWLAFGYQRDTQVLVQSRNIFAPIKLDQGRNVGLFAAKDQLLLSGFSWETERRQLAQKPFLMEEPLGRGHLVAFTVDPNFRAFSDGLNLLFLNALFFGPAH